MASLKSKRDALVTKAKEEKLKAEQQTVETKPIDAQAEEVKNLSKRLRPKPKSRPKMKPQKPLRTPKRLSLSRRKK